MVAMATGRTEVYQMYYHLAAGRVNVLSHIHGQLHFKSNNHDVNCKVEPSYCAEVYNLYQ